MIKRRRIVIQFTQAGYHFYPYAPEEVAFLRQNHRHLFHFVLHFAVDHDDRQQEFFILKRRIQEGMRSLFGAYSRDMQIEYEFGAMSCEAIAEKLLEQYEPADCKRVEVWEDGENGAIVEYV